MKKKFGKHPNKRWSRLNPKICIAMIIVHVMTLFALFHFSWSGLLIAGASAAITGFGITTCYHRLLTHSSFKTSKWFKYVLTTAAVLSWEGGPITWVGNHRIHHKHSDEEGDPHTPGHGLFWSHMWWLLYKQPDGQDPWEVTKDLQKDRGLMFLHRYFWAPQVLLAGLLYGSGYLYGGHEVALSWIIWGIGVRTTAVFHWTWTINSIAHTVGSRNFETKDDSRNLGFLMGLVTLGEGYHNNHHAQQRSAAHGMKRYEVDLTYAFIRFLSLIGLAWDIVPPKPPD